MKVGVFTPLLSQLPLADVLKKLKAHDISTLELGTGNYPGDAHCQLSMLTDRAALDTFKQTLADHGFSISALSCHGNPLHPDHEHARHDQDISRKTIRLAEKLGVSVVVDFSGCPGDSAKAKYPNWVTCPWPPDYLEVLKWQWEKVVEPYWIKQAKFAADHGVKIAIEMHPGFVCTARRRCSDYARSLDRRWAATTIRATCSGRASDPIAAVRVLATPSSTCMPRTLRFTKGICR